MATQQEKDHVRSLLADLENPTIVELGAHTGEEEEWFRRASKGSLHHIMVEPDTRNVKYLLDKPTGNTRRVIVAAVSDKDGVAEFHFSENKRDNNHASGSLRKPTGHLEHLPWITFPFKGMVETLTLDSIFGQERLKKIDLLWVDIQGAERNMIAGGQKALSHTRYVFMEAETVELYEGEALKADLIAALPGWTLLADFGSNILLRNENFAERGQEVQVPQNIPVSPAGKIVGIMPVRNEDWCLELTLRGALAWCDAIVVLDHASTDNCRPSYTISLTNNQGRLRRLHEDNPAWDEMRHRQSLLEAARELGATHIAMIDADEALSAPIAAHIRQAILNLPDKTVLQVPWIILRGSLNRYHLNGIWGDRWVSMAFKDSPGFGGKAIHSIIASPSEPNTRSDLLATSTAASCILWGVSERRLRAKHALYKITERIRWPEKSIREIEAAYNFWKGPTQPGEAPWEFGNVPAEWWAGYDTSMITECGEVPWQEAECVRLLEEYGSQKNSRAWICSDLAAPDLLKGHGTDALRPEIVFSLCHATARFPQWKDAAAAWLAKCDHPETCRIPCSGYTRTISIGWGSICLRSAIQLQPDRSQQCALLLG